MKKSTKLKGMNRIKGSPQEFVKHSLLLGFLRSGIAGGRVAIEAIVTRHQCSGPSKEFALSQRSTGILSTGRLSPGRRAVVVGELERKRTFADQGRRRFLKGSHAAL